MSGAEGQACALGTRVWWPCGHLWMVKADTHPDASLLIRRWQALAAVLVLNPAGSCPICFRGVVSLLLQAGPLHISILISQPFRLWPDSSFSLRLE